MGIKQLAKFIGKYAPNAVNKVPLSELSGQIAVIDLSNLIYRYSYKADSKTKGYVYKAFVEFICKLIKNGIRPIFVADGQPTDEKKEEMESRHLIKQNKQNKLGDINDEIKVLLNGKTLEELDDVKDAEIINKIISLQTEHSKISNNIINVSFDDYNQVIQLIELLGIPVMRAQHEADFLCAKLCKVGIADFIISEDMDMLVHDGTEVLIREIDGNDSRNNGIITRYKVTDILSDLKVTHSEFVDLCILLGCDYTDTVTGIGPAGAVAYIQKYRTIEKMSEQLTDFNFKTCNYLSARKMFYSSNNEVVNKVVFNTPDLSACTNFLSSKTSYRNGTIKDKLDIIKSLEPVVLLPRGKLSVNSYTIPLSETPANPLAEQIKVTETKSTFVIPKIVLKPIKKL